jgi:hypothetical protein
MRRRLGLVRGIGVPGVVALAGLSGYCAVEASVYALGRMTGVGFAADASMDAVGLVLAEGVAALATWRRLGVADSSKAGALAFGLCVLLALRFLLDHDLGAAGWGSGQGAFDWTCIGLAAIGGALAGGITGAALQLAKALDQRARRLAVR